MREKKVAYTRSKASSEASDDASPDAFCVQSVPDGASGADRGRANEQKRKSLYAAVEDRSGWSTRACKLMELQRAESRREGEVRRDGGM